MMELKEREAWAVIEEILSKPTKVIGVYTEKEFADLRVSKLKREDGDIRHTYKTVPTELHELL